MKKEQDPQASLEAYQKLMQKTDRYWEMLSPEAKKELEEFHEKQRTAPSLPQP